jgi:hypothetical protein
MRPAGSSGEARADDSGLPPAPQLETEAARRGWTITLIGDRGCLRLTKDGSVMFVGAGSASRAEAIGRLLEIRRYARRRRP